uniref:EF-hand domain-containing protein n=1 Tax=Arion vulgaris TaxID=1028688 RepID=A0A0B7AJQ3_9EUPU
MLKLSPSLLQDMMKKMQLFPVIILLSLVTVSLQQPPGVPPRQNQPHGGHGQPQNQQHQEVHEQPQEHGQPHHQQPQDSHGHGHHANPLEFSSEFHNADHILEHLEKVVATKPKDQLTQEELEFHYFKLHDYDNNNKLDGVEITKALTHIHEDGDKTVNATDSGTQKPPAPVMSDDDLAKTVDGIMDTFDQDKNGYVEYFEFKRMSQNTAGTP